MIKIKEFDNWIADTEKMDSGKGKKVWLINPNNERSCGWFKFVKKTSYKGNSQKNINTYENVSEKIAELIANKIGVKNARIEIGSYKNEFGCLSYNLLGDNRMMAEGVAYISRRFENFDVLTGFDSTSKRYYSIKMILESLPNEQVKMDFYKMIIFDFLIGNSDRHSNNWAIIKNKSNIESLAPLYDNGSSLCSLVKDDEIRYYFGTDDNRFNSLVDTKSRTLIRINDFEKKCPTHKEVIQYLKENYYEETIGFVNNIFNKMTDENICFILRRVNEYILESRFELLRKYLNAKVLILKEIYKG